MKSPTQSQLDGAALSRLDSLVTPTPKLMLHHYQADQVRLQAGLVRISLRGPGYGDSEVIYRLTIDQEVTSLVTGKNDDLPCPSRVYHLHHHHH